MKKLFANKLNILLVFLLIVSLGILGFFSYKLLTDEKKIIVPDFSDKTETEVNEWCNSLQNNPCVISKEYSDKVSKDKVIYQSLSSGQELDGNISIVISLGSNVEIEPIKIDKNTTKEDVEKWAKDNALTNVKYISEESESVEKGCVISISPEKIINTDTQVIVTISLGKDSTSNEIVVNSSKYVGLSESDFIKKTKALGLKPEHSENKDASSSTVQKGTIVWHGSGTYVEDEVIHYGLSLGAGSEIIVEPGDFEGLEYEEFKKKVEELGLVPKHNENRTDGYSEKIKENCILWHGSGTYVNGETITYTLSKGNENGEIVVKSGDYVGLTLDEFKKKAEELGIVPKHNETREDDYSSTVAKGSILWHGSGTYVKGENITYTLSKGQSEDGTIRIEKGTYVGKTYEEFEKAVKALGLKPEHSTIYTDDPSDTIPKGCLDWHGSGDYVKGEVIHYSLSTGKKQDDSETKVNVVSYKGKTESEFKDYLKSLGISAGNKTSEYSNSISAGLIISNDTGNISTNSKVNYIVSLGKDLRVNVEDYSGKNESELTSFLSNNGLLGSKSSEYSSSVEAGKIIKNDTGKKEEGDTVKYTVSLGVKLYHINNFDIVASPIEKSSFEETKKAALTYFEGIGFTNVSVVGEAAQAKTPGYIISISVNGDTGALPGDFTSDAPIIITVCNKTLN